MMIVRRFRLIGGHANQDVVDAINSRSLDCGVRAVIKRIDEGFEIVIAGNEKDVLEFWEQTSRMNYEVTPLSGVEDVVDWVSPGEAPIVLTDNSITPLVAEMSEVRGEIERLESDIRGIKKELDSDPFRG